MSRRHLAAAVLCLSFLLRTSAPAAAVETPKPLKAPTPSQAVAALVVHEPPKGWKHEEYANAGGAEPVVAYSDGLDRITIRVFGAKGSAYRSPASFLAGPAASTMGQKPEAAGGVTAAGRRLPLYRHGFPINLGDPHAAPRPTILGREVFCILPASGGRFLVLAYARESPAPDLERHGEKAWESFLKTVNLVGRKT